MFLVKLKSRVKNIKLKLKKKISTTNFISA